MTRVTTPQLGIDVTENIASSSAVAKWGRQLGQQVQGVDNTVFINIKATSAISQYAAVGIDENYAGQPLTKGMADDGWMIGFAQTALTKGNYGWVALRGSNIKCLCLKSCAADVTLYTTGTAGTLDDTSGSQTNIDGVVAVTAASASAPAAGQAVEVIATWPRSTTF